MHAESTQPLHSGQPKPNHSQEGDALWIIGYIVMRADTLLSKWSSVAHQMRRGKPRPALGKQCQHNVVVCRTAGGIECSTRCHSYIEDIIRDRYTKQKSGRSINDIVKPQSKYPRLRGHTQQFPTPLPFSVVATSRPSTATDNTCTRGWLHRLSFSIRMSAVRASSISTISSCSPLHVPVKTGVRAVKIRGPMNRPLSSLLILRSANAANVGELGLASRQ